MSRNRVVALGYPLLVIAILVATASVDAFLIFENAYMTLTMVALPLVLIAYVLVPWRRAEAGRWYWRVITCVWVAAVTFGHFFIVVQIAAGV